MKARRYLGYDLPATVQQRTELKLEIFEKLWPFRRHRLSAAGGRETSSKDKNLDATAEATAEVVRKYHQRLLSVQPDLANTALSSQQLAAKMKARVKELLMNYQNAITPGSPSFNCATHVRSQLLLDEFCAQCVGNLNLGTVHAYCGIIICDSLPSNSSCWFPSVDLYIALLLIGAPYM